MKIPKRSRINGNVVYFAKDWLWRYEDDDSPLRVDGKLSFKPCPKCGKLPTKEGHDACLGTLPGVKFACCGHGVTQGYISFENGVRISINKYAEISGGPLDDKGEDERGNSERKAQSNEEGCVGNC